METERPSPPRGTGALCARCGRPLTRAGAALACEPCGLRLDFGNDRFERRRLLGRGAFGSVYLAFDRRLNREIALKYLHVQEPEDLARFQREARLNATLVHPNIVAVHDLGEDADGPFIVMDYVPGRAASELTPTAREAADFVRQAAEAVHHAHGRGVIHRDLKPGNILVHEGRAFVGDFGLAKRVGTKSSLSLTGDVIGTPAYMPPEQAQGRVSDIGPASDVYALGATLYAMLCGRPPFEASDVFELVAKVVAEEPAPPAGVDPGLSHVVLKCLEKEPKRRYATAQEAADDLKRWLDGEAVRARPPSLAYRWRRRIARNRLAWTLGAALALVAPVFLAYRYDRARRLGDDGRTAAARGDVELAAQHLAASVELWSIAENETALADALARLQEFKLGMQANRLGVEYDRVHALLRDELESAESVALGARPLHPEARDRLLAKVEETLAGAGPGTSLPHAYRAWIHECLGDSAAADAELARAVEAGGLDRGDPYGLLFQARIEVRRVFRAFEPDLMVGSTVQYARGGSHDASLERTRISSLDALQEMRSWRGFEHLREASHYPRYLSAIVALVEGRDADAAAELESLVDNPELGMEAMVLAGIARLKLQELDAASVDLARVANARPTWPRPRSWLGIVLLMQARRLPPVEAEVRVAEAVRLIRDACELNQEDAFTRTDLGNARLQLAPLLGGDPREELDRAVADYRKAISLDPRIPSAHGGLAMALVEIGGLSSDPTPYYTEALASYGRAIEVAPGRMQDLNNRGTLLLKWSNVDGADPRERVRLAIADFRAACEVRRGATDPIFNLGMALGMLSHHDLTAGEDARATYEEAIHCIDEALDGGHPPDVCHSNRGMLYMGLGTARVRRGEDGAEDDRRSLADLDRAAELGVDTWKLHNARGNVLVRFGRFEEAAAAYEKALERNPGSESIRRRLETAKQRVAESDF